jgi:hypothetical protein
MAIVNTVMNLGVPYDVVKFLSSWATSGFSRRVQLHGVNGVWWNSGGSSEQGLHRRRGIPWLAETLLTSN